MIAYVRQKNRWFKVIYMQIMLFLCHKVEGKPSLSGNPCQIFKVLSYNKRRETGVTFINFSYTNMFPNSTLLIPTRNAANHNNTNPDCLTRESTPQAEIVLKALAYFVILLVSLVGNLLIVSITYRNKQLRKSINFFIFNMAVSDSFNPLTIMPIQIVHIISGSSWHVDNPWMLGDILCKLCYFLPDVSLVVSIESLLLISVDRFVAAIFPLCSKLESLKARLTSILFTWIVAIAVHAPYFYTFKLRTNPYDNKTYCISSWDPEFDHVETNKRFVTATFVAFILFPLCVFAIVYGTIARVLKKKNKQLKLQLSYRQRCQEKQLRKIVRMSVALIIAFVACTIPQLCFLFARIFLWNWEEPAICSFRTVIPFIAIFMLHSWSAVNPCICLISNKIYFNSFRKILHLTK